MTVNSNITNYLKDTNFLRYVFEGTAAQLRYWRGYMARRPQERNDLLKAKYILLHLEEMRSEFSPAEIEGLKARIQASLNMEKAVF